MAVPFGTPKDSVWEDWGNLSELGESLKNPMKLEIFCGKKMDGRRRIFSETKQDGWMGNENHQRLTHETFLVDRILPATKIDSFASYSVPGWYIQGNV